MIHDGQRLPVSNLGLNLVVNDCNYVNLVNVNLSVNRHCKRRGSTTIDVSSAMLTMIDADKRLTRIDLVDAAVNELIDVYGL